MAHIHTKPGQFDQTVSAYIVRLDGPEPRLMLHRHKLIGFYLQFGGHIELNENPWAAIVHELREESGYELGQLDLWQPAERMVELHEAVNHPLPFSYISHEVASLAGHLHTDVAWGFSTREEPRFKPGDDESVDIRLLTRAELVALDNTEIFENVREVGLFMLDVILTKWHCLPAAEVGM